MWRAGPDVDYLLVFDDPSPIDCARGFKQFCVIGGTRPESITLAHDSRQSIKHLAGIRQFNAQFVDLRLRDRVGSATEVLVDPLQLLNPGGKQKKERLLSCHERGGPSSLTFYP
jgi:hypothetical protein